MSEVASAEPVPPEAAPHRAGPEVIIVVPVYGHSILVCDALDSVLAQPASPRVMAVVVNDGCKNPETHWTCLEYASANPDRIVYLQKSNQGLSAARNTGIDWALREHPDVEAIYFLDADNILIEGGIAEALDTMRASGADWIYPPYTATGVHAVQEQISPFSPTQLLRLNYMDAGSLVSRRIFDAGLRFDETMKDGYEDWEFWLSAMSHGFRAVYGRDLGLLYRKRPESMLSDSDLLRNDIISKMRKKHQELYHPARQVSLSAGERPRYALLRPGRSGVRLWSFVNDEGIEIDKPGLERLFWWSMLSGNDHAVPAFCVWMEDELWECLDRQRILAWLLVDAERSLRTLPVYGGCIDASLPDGELRVEWGGIPRRASVVVLRGDLIRAILKDGSTDWLENILISGGAHEVCRIRTIQIPAREKNAVRRLGFTTIDDVGVLARSAFRQSMGMSWQWKPVTLPATQFSVLADPYDDAVPLPFRTTGKDITFTLPIAEFGGVDRVAYNVACALRAQGWIPHLVVTERLRVRLPADFAGVFETISFVDNPSNGNWSGKGFYYGTGLSSWGSDGSWMRLWELVWFSRALINNHAIAGDVVVGRLRKHGVATFTHQHLLDVDRLGHVSGHPLIGLAYESGYAGLLGCSRAICNWLISQGAPPEKVTEIRSGPGFLVTNDRAREIVNHRLAREPDRLRVLYLGRLDRQKGLNALIEVHRQSLKAGLPIAWRVVGEAMVDEAQSFPPAFRDIVEPAVFDAEDILRVLAWADVLVLASDYEGLPLVLIEAMLAGVVPITTNVGSISELVADGRNGFLVDLHHRDREILLRLELLCADRRRLKSMSLAAHETGCERNDWVGATAALNARLKAHIEQTRWPGGAAAHTSGG